LAREHIHDLRAGDARHEFHREGGEAGGCHGGKRLGGIIGIHDGEDERAFFDQLDLCGRRPADLEDDFGILQRVLGGFCDGCTGGGEIIIRHAGLGACARLHGDGGAEGYELFNGFSRGGDTGFDRIRFRNNCDAHKTLHPFSSVTDGLLRQPGGSPAPLSDVIRR